MKIVIINCFDTYENRVDLIYEYFKEKNFDVTVIQSDFRHFKKIRRTDKKKDFVLVKTKQYTRNLSFKRILSHYLFSRDAFKIVDEIKPDIIYTLVPPNSLVSFSAKYKKKNTQIKVIFDLIDLWPETMPIGKIKNIFPFNIWRDLRNYSLKSADLVITECELYQRVLKKFLKCIDTECIYLAKKNADTKMIPSIVDGEIHLAYLGSINNIIDIEKIREVIEVIKKSKPVILHVIGDGENREKLLREAKAGGATVKYYGEVYDFNKKQEIFNKCHYGLNIMKETVCVGLTMKSIDYFQHGLPIINNIPADTESIVEEYQVGINLRNIDKLSESINQNEKNFIENKYNSLHVFESLFSTEAFKSKLNKKIETLLLDKNN